MKIDQYVFLKKHHYPLISQRINHNGNQKIFGINDNKNIHIKTQRIQLKLYLKSFTALNAYFKKKGSKLKRKNSTLKFKEKRTIKTKEFEGRKYR